MNDSVNALKFVTELLSTYTKETASKGRDDACKYDEANAFKKIFDYIF
jgi:hypothetical protein